MSEPVTYPVAQLGGALLDQAVALVIGIRCRMHLVPAPIYCQRFDAEIGWIPFSPSADERLGLSIIKNHGIGTLQLNGDDQARAAMLVAALRAFVETRHDDTIMLPGILP